MSDKDELNPAEREFEAALKSLAPAASRVDPVAAAYEAGQRSAQREVRIWRVAVAAMLLIGAGTWLLPVGRSELAVQPARPTTVVAVATPLPALSAQSIVMLRKTVSEKGVDGLSPVQLAPVKTIDLQEINPTHRGES